MSFSQMGLAPQILRVLQECGYEEPTPIQKQAIPAVMTGRDIIACAQTGTGKTAAFTLPLIHRLSALTQGSAKPRASVLVLTPTRELALQVGESVRTYSKYLSVRAAIIYGGVNINSQIQQLRGGVDVLVATPGRLLDHMQQRTVDLSGVNVLVLDEADRMLDMGFIRDVRKIIASLPKERQNLLFSATFSREIKALACELLKTPTVIEVASRTAAADSVEQCVHPVDRSRKRALLSMLIRNNDWQQVLVFTRTKHGANRLAKQLEQDGLSATAIHGNKSQAARVLALKQFKSGDVRILVATDIAARGIDITQLPYVVNYDLPNVPEDYVHRIGRTGRAGCEGKAVSLVSADEQKLLEAIERLLKHKIPSVLVPNFGPELAAGQDTGDDEDYERQARSGRPQQQRQGAPRSSQPRGEGRQAGNQRSEGQGNGSQRQGNNQRNDNAQRSSNSQRNDNSQRRGNGQRSESPNGNQSRDQQRHDRQRQDGSRSNSQREANGNQRSAAQDRGEGRPQAAAGNSLRKADDKPRHSAPSNRNNNKGRSSSHDRHAMSAGHRFFSKISKKLAEDEQDEESKEAVNSKSTTVQAPTRRRWFFL